MKQSFSRLFFLSFVFCLGSMTVWAAKAIMLRCEYMDRPLSIDLPAPRLSWQMHSSKRGDRQTAYQILVASSIDLLQPGKADLWDSGKVASNQSLHVPYAGRTLISGETCYWQVRIWDRDEQPSRWSEVSTWSMGLLNREAWAGACWIAFKESNRWRQEWNHHKADEAKRAKLNWPWYNGKGLTIWELFESANPHYDPSPLFRKEFELKGRIREARLYICGLGYYEAFINGHRVGDHVLDPAWTNYHKKSFYVTHDVTELLQTGNNAIGVMLGRGQYNPLCNDIWGLNKSSWVDQPKLRALLEIRYTDGQIKRVVTDSSWKTTGGPILFDDTRQGELYDARLEQPGWDTPGFNASGWRPAAQVTWETDLRSQLMPPIRCFDPITPVKEWNQGNGSRVYDLGRNIAGSARMVVSGPEGARVLVEYCELPSDTTFVPLLHPSKLDFKIDDPFYASFYDKAINIRQQNGYILRGEGKNEKVECHFAYMGFRYLRVTADSSVTIHRVEGIPVHTDVASAGSFTCSNSILNQLQEASRKTLLNNFQSIPTDCPHREKQGWTADAYMTDRAAIYNFDMATFYTKWLDDLAGTQDSLGGLCTVAPSTGYTQSSSTVWPAAMVFIPLDLYDYYGDRQLLERYYGVMDRFARSSLLRQVEGKPEIIREVLGDWLSPMLDTLNNWQASPEGLIVYGTASHYRVVRKLADIAWLLGKKEESLTLKAWAARIAKAFHQEYYDPEQGCYHGDRPSPDYRQSVNAVPLEYGIVPREHEAQVLKSLTDDLATHQDRIRTGFMGTMALLDLLPERDPERAFRLVTQPEYPGWAYMLHDGSDTIWESWDGFSSRNHPPFCMVSAYFYRYLAGIRCDRDAPGFKRVVIAPSVVGNLTYVTAHHDSMYGRIESHWTYENGRFELQITIPANCTAQVVIPTSDPTSIQESGKPLSKASQEIRLVRYADGKMTCEVSSGRYKFSSLYKKTPM